MSTLLQIRTSISSTEGDSSKLSALFVERWKAANPEGRVILRDLAAEPIPHLTAERFAAFVTPAADRSPEQTELVRESDALIAELNSADVLVLGLPMYNFGIPSTLKSWFDNVARAGVTFRYTESGSIGLLDAKPLYIFATRGGLYDGTGRDFQTGQVTLFFNLLGIQDIHFEYAEGLNISPERKTEALQAARERIDSLL